jgi:hypothetical protein
MKDRRAITPRDALHQEKGLTQSHQTSTAPSLADDSLPSGADRGVSDSRQLVHEGEIWWDH